MILAVILSTASVPSIDQDEAWDKQHIIACNVCFESKVSPNMYLNYHTVVDMEHVRVGPKFLLKLPDVLSHTFVR